MASSSTTRDGLLTSAGNLQPLALPAAEVAPGLLDPAVVAARVCGDIVVDTGVPGRPRQGLLGDVGSHRVSTSRTDPSTRKNSWSTMDSELARTSRGIRFRGSPSRSTSPDQGRLRPKRAWPTVRLPAARSGRRGRPCEPGRISRLKPEMRGGSSRLEVVKVTARISNRP